MKNVTSLMLALLLQGFLFQTALAQEEKTVMVPLPSQDDFTRGEDGWALGLGLGIEYETAYEGSDEFGFEIDPAGALQWRSGDNIFYFAGEAFGWRGLRADTWLLEALVGFEEGREEGDSDKGYLDGLGESDEGLELVLQARYAFTEDWRYWLVSRVVASENGNLGLFGVGRRFGDQLDGSGLEVNLVAVFHDSDYANNGFGITAQQSVASGLDETRISSGLRSVGIDFSYRHHINDSWQIYGEALYEYFSSDVRSSPIARSNYETEIGVGFIYVF
ncbi:MipA/OmpV family protein [Aliidiomarina sedimenti]|uniref:MipA/OmpV family protein n=1 Tax=Aliidiomarina sedimenti TaxID=1933879 RepID=A0ABY0C0Q0_9GAMM|nr:MipA/OmpV family protein [Aliidiomarina sedimenti]RUO30794.1 MipA/OmpV family protein [Aliidiomarina sedimenti]